MTDRSHRSDRSHRTDRTDRTDKSSRSHKSNESHRSDRSDKIYKSDSINRTSKTYGFIRPIRPIHPIRPIRPFILFFVLKKHPYSECFFIVCIISRILSWTVIYLGVRLLARSSGTLSTYVESTALHWGKDFAVSFSYYYQTNPMKDLLSFRLSRFCSHLSRYRGRGLPATFCLSQS